MTFPQLTLIRHGRVGRTLHVAKWRSTSRGRGPTGVQSPFASHLFLNPQALSSSPIVTSILHPATLPPNPRKWLFLLCISPVPELFINLLSSALSPPRLGAETSCVSPMQMSIVTRREPRFLGFMQCQVTLLLRSRWIWTSIWSLLRNRWEFGSPSPWTAKSLSMLLREGYSNPEFWLFRWISFHFVLFFMSWIVHGCDKDVSRWFNDNEISAFVGKRREVENNYGRGRFEKGKWFARWWPCWDQRLWSCTVWSCFLLKLRIYDRFAFYLIFNC